jgi:hypothetical protein
VVSFISGLNFACPFHKARLVAEYHALRGLVSHAVIPASFCAAGRLFVQGVVFCAKPAARPEKLLERLRRQQVNFRL